MIRNSRQNSPLPLRKETSSGLAQLMTVIHDNAAGLVNSKTFFNGPDQILTAANFTTNRRNGIVKLRRDTDGLGADDPISIPSLLTEVAEAYPQVVALKAKGKQGWRSWTYEELLRDVQLVAKSFIHVGLRRHHSVLILGRNSAEWVIANYSAIFAGGISCGVHPLRNEEEITLIATESKADIILVENDFVLQKILKIQHNMKDLRVIIQYKGEPSLSDKRKLHRDQGKHILCWGQALQIGQEVSNDLLSDRLKRVAINHCCSLFYSNGKFGDSRPKGALFSHDNLTWSAKMIRGIVRAPGFNNMLPPGGEVLLSYLPLEQVGTHSLDLYYTLCSAGTLCFPNVDDNVLYNYDKLFNVISEVKPSLFMAPASIYRHIYNRFLNMKHSMSGFNRFICDWSCDMLRCRESDYINAGLNEEPGKLIQLQTALAKSTINKKCKESIGFSCRTIFLSRDEHVSAEISHFLAGFDIIIHETYGQTETCGFLTANIPKRFCKFESSGKAAPGVHVKVDTVIDDNDVFPFISENKSIGEIWSYGRNIFMGYLSGENFVSSENELKVETALQDWHRTDDIGYLDDENYCFVFGNKSNYISLGILNGDMVWPVLIEQMILLELPCLVQAMIFSDNPKESLYALLTIDTRLDPLTMEPQPELTNWASNWFKQSKFEIKTMEDVFTGMDSGIRFLIQAGIDRVNLKTCHFITNWKIMPKQFTYSAGEMEIFGKLKRNNIMRLHESTIESLFQSQAEVGLRHKRSSISSNTSDVSVGESKVPCVLTQIKEEDETSKSSSRASPASSSSTPKSKTRKDNVTIVCTTSDTQDIEKSTTKIEQESDNSLPDKFRQNISITDSSASNKTNEPEIIHGKTFIKDLLISDQCCDDLTSSLKEKLSRQ